MLIAKAAMKHGVPAAALCALRIAENGGPGREFGVLSTPAPTYEDQVDIAARSFKNAEGRFHGSGRPRIARTADGRYTEEFLRFFSHRWAPVGAENDPNGLNKHHADNLIEAYWWFD